MFESSNRALTVGPAARRVGASENTIRNWCNWGMPHVRYGYFRVIYERDLLEFAQRIRKRVIGQSCHSSNPK